MALMDGVREDMKAVGDRGASAVGRNQNTPATRVILKPMKRALDAIADKLPCTQGRPAVSASVL